MSTPSSVVSFVDIVNLAHRDPEAILYDKFHSAKVNVKDVQEALMGLVRAGFPPEVIQDEVTNYALVSTKDIYYQKKFTQNKEQSGE